MARVHTVTVWQVKVDDQWRWINTRDAARMSALICGRLRLDEVTIEERIRFERMKKPAAIEVPSPRRVAAANRALAGKVERAGLWAAEVAAELPTAEERIRHFDEAANLSLVDRRSLEGRQRRRAIAVYRALPLATRIRVALGWVNWMGPHNAHSLTYLCRRAVEMEAA